MDAKKRDLSSIIHNSYTLKGQCHKIFCFWFFFMKQFPPAPRYSISTVSNFFKNSQRYSQVNMHLWYQWHRRQIFPPVSLMLLMPLANWPPLSTTPLANCHRVNDALGKLPPYQRHWRVSICSLYYPKVSKRNNENLSNQSNFHLPPVSMTLMVHLELWISLWSFEKIQKQPLWYNQKLEGNWSMKKTLNQKPQG